VFDSFELPHPNGAYDFTITTNSDAEFLRRFAGRVEAAGARPAQTIASGWPRVRAER
jgi:hypothetical protein